MACPFLSGLSLLPTVRKSISMGCNQISIQPGHPSVLLTRFQHIWRACSCVFRTSLLSSVQPSWTTWPFRIASQGILSISLWNRPKFAHWKSKVAVLVTSLHFSKTWEPDHYVINVPKMALSPYNTCKFFSISKQQTQQGILLFESFNQLCQGVFIHTL